eukprot:m.31773 g.31773  ORF g.31773 m.31773 type:complete len:349 (+) comp10718_c0_seq1:285-1331(+)
MAADISKQLFGFLHKPLLLLVLVVDMLIVFFPSPSIGKIFVPFVVQMTFAAHNIMAFFTGDEMLSPDTFEGELPVSTILPLSLALVGVIYTFERLTQMLVANYATKGDAPKFAESFVRCTYYFVMFFVAVYVISTEDYWPNVANCWPNSQATGPERQKKSILLQCNYLFELSYYTAGIVLHSLVDEKLSDFWVMFLHHVVTICLLGFSYTSNFHRIGMLVLMVHDVSDIFLDSGKCFHFIRLESFATVTFVGLITSWAWYRLFIYPTKLIYSSTIDVFNIVFIEEGHEPFFTYYCLATWLCVLQVLHVYWFYLILRVAQKHIMEGKLEDVRMKNGDHQAVKTSDKKTK